MHEKIVSVKVVEAVIFFFLHDFGQTHLNLISKTTLRINNGNMDIFIHTTKYEKTKPFWPTELLNRIAQEQLELA